MPRTKGEPSKVFCTRVKADLYEPAYQIRDRDRVSISELLRAGLKKEITARSPFEKAAVKELAAGSTVAQITEIAVELTKAAETRKEETFVQKAAEVALSIVTTPEKAPEKKAPPKKRGRLPKAKPETAPKKRGRPPKAKPKATTPKKRKKLPKAKPAPVFALLPAAPLKPWGSWREEVRARLATTKDLSSARFMRQKLEGEAQSKMDRKIVDEESKLFLAAMQTALREQKKNLPKAPKVKTNEKKKALSPKKQPRARLNR